jgi:hypothetical protein
LASAAPPTYRERLDPQTLGTIKSRFGTLMELANRRHLTAMDLMFWQSLGTSGCQERCSF